MRKIFILFVLTITLSSCSNDNDNKESSNKQNYIELNDKSDKLTKAYIDRVENRESESEFSLILLSEKGSVNFMPDGHIDYVNQEGSGISADLNSINGSDIEIGEYFYESNGTKSFTFNYADGGLLMGEGGSIFTVRDGKITIKENGGNYEITFELETNLGEIVKGQYSGSAITIDF